MTTNTTIKSYYVLGRNQTTGVLVRCSDKDAADYELGLMRYSDCNKIARTVRPVTEAQALAWFPAGIQLSKRERL